MRENNGHEAGRVPGDGRAERRDALSMLSLLSCPVCRGSLAAATSETNISSVSCPRGHSYDIARGGISPSKNGYINLLMSNRSSAGRHGDDRLMLNARAEFLDGGYYLPICDTLAGMTLPLAADKGSGTVIIDCGCGEGWYARQLLDIYAGNGVFPGYIGIDISKTAVRMAAVGVHAFAVGRGYRAAFYDDAVLLQNVEERSGKTRRPGKARNGSLR